MRLANDVRRAIGEEFWDVSRDKRLGAVHLQIGWPGGLTRTHVDVPEPAVRAHVASPMSILNA